MAAKIKRGDRVLVLTGKDKGTISTVKRVFPRKGRAIVENVNVVKKHQRARREGEVSGIVEIEAPIHLSNLMLVCPRCHEPTRVGFRFRDDGRKVRYCKRCKEDIDE